MPKPNTYRVVYTLIIVEMWQFKAIITTMVIDTIIVTVINIDIIIVTGIEIIIVITEISLVPIRDMDPWSVPIHGSEAVNSIIVPVMSEHHHGILPCAIMGTW